MNVAMESDCIMCGGMKFHSLGAKQLKARAPMVLRRDVGMVSSPVEVERRVQEGLYFWRSCRGKWGLDGAEHFSPVYA